MLGHILRFWVVVDLGGHCSAPRGQCEHVHEHVTCDSQQCWEVRGRERRLLLRGSSMRVPWRGYMQTQSISDPLTAVFFWNFSPVSREEVRDP